MWVGVATWESDGVGEVWGHVYLDTAVKQPTEDIKLATEDQNREAAVRSKLDINLSVINRCMISQDCNFQASFS